jgi:hypothetical protein
VYEEEEDDYKVYEIPDEDWDSEAEDAGGGEWVKGKWIPLNKKKDRWWEHHAQIKKEKLAKKERQEKREKRRGTHSLTHSLAYSLTHWLTHSLTGLLTYSLTGLLTHSLTGLLIHSLAYSLTHSKKKKSWMKQQEILKQTTNHLIS